VRGGAVGRGAPGGARAWAAGGTGSSATRYRAMVPGERPAGGTGHPSKPAPRGTEVPRRGAVLRLRGVVLASRFRTMSSARRRPLLKSSGAEPEPEQPAPV